MENNKKINFEEVIYSSSQKSIVSGMSGFGVRTHSEGVSEDLTDTLSKNGFFGYELSSERMVGMEQLQSNPRIVYDYPETFIYKKITLASGIEKYVFSRTVYLGIDYGYFCGGEHCRTGSNYFSHVLIFDEKPPKEIFDIIVNNNAYNNNVFLPLDYTCSPINRELTVLLTGEPKLIPSNSFNIIQSNQKEFNLTDYMGLVITAVLQLHINGRTDEKEKRLIIKADKEVSKNILDVIKNFIPQAISSDLTFITNHVREGMPDDFDIVFVNQFYNGTLYEDQHICVDLLNGYHMGIGQNFLFDKIKELVKSKDKKTLSPLLDYISEISIDHKSDFRFLYNIFILTKSDKDVLLTDLTPEFIERLANANLSGSNKQIIWKKINKVVDKGLHSGSGKEIIDTLFLIAVLKRNNLGKEISIDSSGKEYFSKILFDTDQYFGRIVNSDNIGIVSQIVVPSIIGNTDRLFASLQTTDNQDVWNTFIRMCFSSADKLISNANLIISRIAGSPLSSASQNNLLLQLYPISGHGEQAFFNFFTTNPNLISKYPDILFQVCRKKPQLYYPELISNSVSNHVAFSLVTSGFVQLINEKISRGENTYAIIENFLLIVRALSKEVIEKLDVDNLMQSFADSMFDNPSDKYKSQIEELQNSGLKIKADKQALLHAIQSLLNNEVPKIVDEKMMFFAYCLLKKDILKDMFDTWMKQGFTNQDLLQFIQNAGGMNNNPQFISYMIISLWKLPSSTMKASRKTLIETIIHNTKWSKDDRNRFIRSGVPEDLATFITKSSGFFNKLFRKLFNIK